ncbi:hypothetical protein [Ruegeria atlantica]|uniref:YMGG-like Gly-zipper domain-containing protein n=1 Tax=Ruegeria atlantica TaxID=81569 RepID=A0A0P1EBG6_9RHOB|nr:hypothetical protein [Ruegeria atlantica]CUH46589.1 hypothetical protein RUA4292_00755 [Ruegeria atlantica]
MLKTRNHLAVLLITALGIGTVLPTPADALSKRTKNTMGGAAIGAGVGYIVGGGNGATGGAVVGAIAGYNKKR